MKHQTNENNGREFPSLGEIAGDLLTIQPWRRATTLTLPFLSFGLYFVFASWGMWSLAVLSVMYFSFVTYGSTSHDLVHRNLGLSRRWNDRFLSIIELLAIRSGTAYRLAHLHHHAHCLEESDIEAFAASRGLARSIFEGFVAQTRIFLWAYRHFPAERRQLLSEAHGCLLIVSLAVFASALTLIPLVYVALVIMGSWIIPLITVYLPHDPNGDKRLHFTRAFRGRVLSLIAMEHLYHLEHHLYPAVPHHHWPTLAKRLQPFLECQGVKLIKLGI